MLFLFFPGIFFQRLLIDQILKGRRFRFKFPGYAFFDMFCGFTGDMVFGEHFVNQFTGQYDGRLLFVNFLFVRAGDFMKFFLKLQEHFLAVVPDRCESLFYDRGKNLLLFCGGAVAAAAEYIFDKLRTGILRIFNIVDQGMDIAASVGKGGENKPGVGSADHPVPDTGADPVFSSR